MLRVWISAAVVAPCMGLLACKSVELPMPRPRTQVPEQGTFISTIDERPFNFGLLAIGQDKDLNLKRGEGMGLIHAPAFTQYAEAILARLQAASPVSEIPVRVRLVADLSWQAYITPDANLYLHLGVLENVANEDQLAFLLAHELAHLILEHHSSDVMQQAQRQALQLTHLSVMASAENLKTAQDSRGPDRRRDVAARKEELASQAELLENQEQLLLLNTAIVAPTWQRGQEQEADILGADLLVGAGYSRNAAIDALRTLAAIELDASRQNQEAGRSSRYAAPTGVDELIDRNQHRLGDQIRASLAEGAASGPYATLFSNTMGRFGENLSFYTGLTMKNLAGRMSRRHRETEQRIDVVSEYLEREYRRAPRPDFRENEWKAALERAQIAQIVDHYEAAFDAQDALTAGRIAEAVDDARRALGGSTSRHPLPRYVFSEVRARQGLWDKALQNLQIAFQYPEPSLNVYRLAAELHLSRGDAAAAVNLLEPIFEQYDNPPVLIPPLIMAYRELEREEEAEDVQRGCVISYPEVTELCQPPAAP